MPIDVVITWVDGNDPRHKAKREHYLNNKKNIAAVSHKARRFSDNGEIYYCLKSIANHMPWVNRIFIITDHQVPSCIINKDTSLASILNKVNIIDHRDIFNGYESLLPTFNSLAIESFMWRIKDLSEHFIYFNDDVFLCGPVNKSTFFKNKTVLLRGQWIDWQQDKLSFHATNNRLGAEMAGYSGHPFFRAAHVCHPLKKSVLQAQFNKAPETFIKNASYRFRNISQFWPIGLHNHCALAAKQAVIKNDQKDWVHFSVAFCRDASAKKIKKRLKRLLHPDILLGCLNFTEAVVEKVPKAMSFIDLATSSTGITLKLQKIKSIFYRIKNKWKIN